MKKKRKLKTRVALSFICTLLILCMIDFSFILPTNSKFLKTGAGGREGNELVYQVGLYPLYVKTEPVSDENIGITIDENDKDVFNFSFEFNRHYAIAYDVSSTNKDNYSFTVTPGCNITKVNDSTDNLNSISFDERGNEDSKVKLELQCNYNTLKGNSTDEAVTITVGIKEKFGIEPDFEDEFLYTEPTFIISDKYYTDLSGKVQWGKTLVVTSDKTYDERIDLYKQWITEYVAPNSGYEALVKNYALRPNFEYYITEFADYWEDENGVTGEGIKGIKVTTDGFDNYTFTWEDNLVGYVRTDNSKATHPEYMYFSTEKKSEIDKAFNYYLEYYQEYYKYTDTDIVEIKDYISKRGGITSIVLNGNLIMGLLYNNDIKELYLDIKLLEYAHNLKDLSTTQIKIMEKANMNASFVAFTNNTLTANNVISPNLNFYDALSTLLGTSRVGNLIYKNNTEEYPVASSFVDYYIVWDEDLHHYVILKIWSDVSKDATHQYNLYEFRTLAIEEREGYAPPTIRFTNGSSSFPDRLTISISLNASDENSARYIIVDTLLTYFNEYFGTTLEESDISFTWNATNKAATANFRVSKGYDDLLPTGGVGSAQRTKEKTESVKEIVDDTVSSMNITTDKTTEDKDSIDTIEDNKEDELVPNETNEVPVTEEIEEVTETDKDEKDVLEDSTTDNVVDDKDSTVNEENVLPMINSIMSFLLKK